MRPNLPILCLLLLTLVACSDRAETDRAQAELGQAERAEGGQAAFGQTKNGASAGDEAQAGVADAAHDARRSSPDVPSGTATSPAVRGGESAGAIGYAGFGPAKFGATQEEVRMAWGKELTAAPPPAEPGACYYLLPRSEPGRGYGIAFMIEGDQFKRLDVDNAGHTAPGGGKVGMGSDEIRRRYPGIEERPHKYVEGGKYLRHTDASGSVLLFVVDAAGKVTEWRVGVPPQVDYVEGCS